jgi:anti-sigma factor RsiW
MNRNNEDLARVLGPCADFEFDLVELSEGSLDPDRVPVVQQHLERCIRCRTHSIALEQLDASLAAALPRPQLSVEFEATLAARVATLRRAPDRAAARADAEQEHRQMLQRLGRGLDWRVLLDAVALGSAVGGALVGLESFAPGLLQALGLVPSRIGASTAFSVVLGVAFLVAGLGFGRKLTGGPLLRRG